MSVKEGIHLKCFAESKWQVGESSFQVQAEITQVCITYNTNTGLQVDEDNQDGYVNRPIVFSEFTFDGDLVIRKDFAMNDMIAHENNLKTNNEVMNQGLFQEKV